MWAHATEMAELPVISAAHVLAPQIYLAVIRAFEAPDLRAEELVARWRQLARPEKDRYIDTAVAILEMRRPKAPTVEVMTGLGPTHGNVIGQIRPKENA